MGNVESIFIAFIIVGVVLLSALTFISDFASTETYNATLNDTTMAQFSAVNTKINATIVTKVDAIRASLTNQSVIFSTGVKQLDELQSGLLKLTGITYNTIMMLFDLPDYIITITTTFVQAAVPFKIDAVVWGLTSIIAIIIAFAIMKAILKWEL